MMGIGSNAIDLAVAEYTGFNAWGVKSIVNNNIYVLLVK